MITNRVARLRQQSLDAQPRISTERAELLTEFDRTCRETAVPVRRALAFQYILEHKAIAIGPGELIVGERGPSPKATPTYPELCCHSLADLDLLDSRPKIPFRVDERSRRVYEESIIPYWQGRSIRDMLFAAMSPEWVAAYDAGMFTEFMEQRAPGHTVCGDRIYRKGFLDIKRDVESHLARLDYLRDPMAYDKRLELRAMRICCDAIIAYAARHEIGRASCRERV